MRRIAPVRLIAKAAGLAAALLYGSAFAPAGAAESIPDFMSIAFGWQLTGGIDFRPVPGAVAPVQNDPRYPRTGNNLNIEQPTERISDVNNPNLTPWAAAQMRMHNDLVLNGKRSFSAQSRCWPGGVPGQLLFPAEPIFFIQTPDQVWIIWQRDHHVRRIYLNRPHSENPKPTWFGESVGHYENGDTLVIDTIGLIEHEYSFVDNWRTPHTKDLHVVERWKIVDGGNAIEATVTVEDPGAFRQPWTGMVRWQKIDRGPMIESVCAENNLNYETYFRLDEYPMPEAKTPDF